MVHGLPRRAFGFTYRTCFACDTLIVVAYKRARGHTWHVDCYLRAVRTGTLPPRHTSPWTCRDCGTDDLSQRGSLSGYSGQLCRGCATSRRRARTQVVRPLPYPPCAICTIRTRTPLDEQGRCALCVAEACRADPEDEEAA